LAAKDAAAIWFLKGRGIIHGITAKNTRGFSRRGNGHQS
jgi:hypothetical protein